MTAPTPQDRTALGALRACIDCAFWVQDEGNGGICHRAAPHTDPEGSSEAWWPATRHNDWCGEFARSSDRALSAEQRSDRSGLPDLGSQGLGNPNPSRRGADPVGAVAVCPRCKGHGYLTLNAAMQPWTCTECGGTGKCETPEPVGDDPVARMAEAVGYAGSKTWDARSCVPPIIGAWPAVAREIARLRAVTRICCENHRSPPDQLDRIAYPQSSSSEEPKVPSEPAGDGLRVAMEAARWQAAQYRADAKDFPPTHGNLIVDARNMASALEAALAAFDQQEKQRCQPQPPMRRDRNTDPSQAEEPYPVPIRSMASGALPTVNAHTDTGATDATPSCSSTPKAAVISVGAVSTAPSSPPGESQTLGVPNGPTEIEAVKRWREARPWLFTSPSRGAEAGDALAFACEFERECNRLGMIALDKEKARADQACKDTLRAVAARLSAEHARDLAEKRLGEERAANNRARGFLDVVNRNPTTGRFRCAPDSAAGIWCRDHDARRDADKSNPQGMERDPRGADSERGVG